MQNQKSNMFFLVIFDNRFKCVKLTYRYKINPGIFKRNKNTRYYALGNAFFTRCLCYVNNMLTTHINLRIFLRIKTANRKNRPFMSNFITDV